MHRVLQGVVKMNVTYTEIRNPRWANLAKTRINCEVNFDHVDWEEFSPFSCEDTEDDYPHVKEIYDRCVAGEFGEIADADVLISNEQSLQLIRESRNDLLTSVIDPVMANPVRWGELSAEKQQEWTDYRQALLDLPVTGIVEWDDNNGIHVITNMPSKPE